MQHLVDEFNRFFEGSAKAEVRNGQLKVTIGNLTWTVRPALGFGGYSNPPKSKEARNG